LSRVTQADSTRYEPRDPNHHGARGVMTVASTLIHRFYMRRSFNDFPDSVSKGTSKVVRGVELTKQLMAGTILFLASKIEEEPLKLRYICNACLDRFHDSPGSGWHPGQQENGVGLHVLTMVPLLTNSHPLHHYIRDGREIS
jgi:hypothetical protein